MSSMSIVNFTLVELLVVIDMLAALALPIRSGRMHLRRIYI